MKYLPYYVIAALFVLIGVLAYTYTVSAAVVTNVAGGGTGSTTLTGILGGNGKNSVRTVGIGSGCTYVANVLSCPGTGASFGYLFTPQSYGNSTTTALGLLGGLISNGSTTIPALGSGLVGANNGKLYGFASSSLFAVFPAAFPFTPQTLGNATGTLLLFNGGAISAASTTIGNGLQQGGLTVSGGATTTGNLFTGTGSSLWSTGPNATYSNAYSITSAGMTYPSVVISTTGNVGIGDVAPTIPLSVIDASGFASVASHNVFTIASSSLGVSSTTLFNLDSSGVLTVTSNSSVNVNYGNTTIGGSQYQCGVSAQTGGGQFLCNFFGASQGTNGGGTAINILTYRFNGANNKLYFGDDSAHALMQSPHPIFITSSASAFDASTTPNLALLTNGNVGVGTTSPFSKLSIHANNGETNKLLFVIASSTASATTTLFSISNTGSIFTLLTDGCVQAASGLLTSTGVACGAGGSSFAYPFIASATSSPLMLLASTTIGNGTSIGGLTISGNATTTGVSNFLNDVNIGTTTDQGNPLFVRTLSGGAAQFMAPTGSAIFALTTPTNAASDSIFEVINNRARIGYNNSVVVLDDNATSKPIQISSGGRVGVAITSANSVGIGTTSPLGKLSIHAFPVDTNLNLFVIASSTPSATTTLFSVSNTGQVYSTGNVGIGSTTPGTLLSLGDTGANTINISPTGTSTFGNGVKINTGGLSIATIGSAILSTISGAVQSLLLSAGFSLTSNTLHAVEHHSFTYATSTAWTGTTTIALEIGYGEVWNSVQCSTNVGTLNTQIGYGSASTTMFNASTTIGTVSFASNNTMTAGNRVKVDLGTPASAPTNVNCTVQDTN